MPELQTPSPRAPFAIVDAATAESRTELLPIAGSEFSIAPALQIAAQLVPFEDACKELEEQGSRIVIDSPGARQRGVEFASLCQDQWAQLEAYRKATSGPVYDYWKYLNSLFSPLQGRLELVKKKALGLIVDYNKAEATREAERQAALRKANEEEALRLAAEREAKGDAKGAEAIMQAATTAPVLAPRASRPMASSTGRTFRTAVTWTARVESPMDVLKAIIAGKLPISLVEFKQAELNRVAREVKAATDANGLHIYQAETGSV